MAGRDEPPGRDPDDWFDEPRVPAELRPRTAPEHEQTIVVDDWLDTEEPHRGGGIRIGDLVLTARQAALAGGVLGLVVLLIALAAAGVFSGSSSPQSAAGTTDLGPTTTAPTTAQQTTTPAPTVAGPTTTLKPGDTGPQVTKLQRALTTLGYSPGKPDGRFGAGTQQAVAAFQKANNLTADGIVGNQTLAALTSALSRAG
jgi:Putative peptidoglycan binding domain